MIDEKIKVSCFEAEILRDALRLYSEQLVIDDGVDETIDKIIDKIDCGCEPLDSNE